MSSLTLSDKPRLELVKLNDDGNTNNYSEWMVKSRLKLKAYDLWKYFEGPESVPPVIPKSKTARRIQGKDKDGNDAVFTIPSNEKEVEDASNTAAPWLANNTKALSLIVESLPPSKLHLVKQVDYAKEAWEAIQAEYRPVNSMRATRLKQAILQYVPRLGWDTVKWREDMQRMFDALTDANPGMMSDQEFARHLITMMPRDGEWQYCSAQLNHKMETLATPLPSKYVIERFRAEDERQRNTEASTSVLMTARAEFNRTSSKWQRPRAEENPTVAYSKPTGYKCPRDSDATTSRPVCENEFCETPVGHTQSDCFAHKGGKQGLYPEWYRGSRIVHLPPNERARIR